MGHGICGGKLTLAVSARIIVTTGSVSSFLSRNSCSLFATVNPTCTSCIPGAAWAAAGAAGQQQQEQQQAQQPAHTEEPEPEVQP